MRFESNDEFNFEFPLEIFFIDITVSRFPRTVVCIVGLYSLLLFMYTRKAPPLRIEGASNALYLASSIKYVRLENSPYTLYCEEKKLTSSISGYASNF